MKRFVIIALSLLLSVSVLPVAIAEQGATESTNSYIQTENPQKILRLDVSSDEYVALGKTLFNEIDNDSLSLHRLDTFPLLPESIVEMTDELKNYSSSLEANDNWLYWHTEATKCAYDEHMVSVKGFAEFDGGKGYISVYDNSIGARDGIVCFKLPEGYSLEQLESISIHYDPFTWLGGDMMSDHAQFVLSYSVVDGKLNNGSVNVVTEYGGFCLVWNLYQRDADNPMTLEMSFENLSNDHMFFGKYNAETGEKID